MATRNAPTRRQLAGGASGGAAGLVLAACGQVGGSAQPAQTLPPATIEYMHFAAAGGPQALAREEAARKFMARVPEVQVTVSLTSPSGAMLEKFKTTAAAGTPPDLLTLNAVWRPDLVASSLITPLDPLLQSRPRGFQKDAFLPDATAALQSDGKLWGVPRFVVTSVIFYNKDLFAKLGIAAPAENWTWEREYVEAARQLTRDAGGEQAYGMDFPSEFRDTAVYAWGGEFFDKTGTKCLLDAARPIAGLEFAHDLRWKRRLLASPDAERAMNARTMFLNERIGMYQRGNFELGNLTAQKPAFRIGAVLTPKGPAGRRQYGTLDFYGISEGSKQKPAAWEFAKWLVGDEGQQHLVNTETITPATKKAYQSPDVAPEIWRVFTEATTTAVFVPPVRNYTDIAAAISRELGTALNDNARSVPDAARAAATAATQLMVR